MSEICAECGKPITMGQPSYYRKRMSDDIGQSVHSECGDPFGAKAKDAEIARLTDILTRVANDSRAWHLHEPTKELLRPFIIETLEKLPNKTVAEGFAGRTGHAARS